MQSRQEDIPPTNRTRRKSSPRIMDYALSAMRELDQEARETRKIVKGRTLDAGVNYLYAGKTYRGP